MYFIEVKNFDYRAKTELAWYTLLKIKLHKPIRLKGQ